MKSKKKAKCGIPNTYEVYNFHAYYSSSRPLPERLIAMQRPLKWLDMPFDP
jgi:hypothetical protein